MPETHTFDDTGGLAWLSRRFRSGGRFVKRTFSRFRFVRRIGYDATMWLRIFGGVVFLWMGASTVAGIVELRNRNGVVFQTDLAVLVFTGAFALIGLLLALGYNRPKAPPPESPKNSQN